jgi:hypothetical protein
MWWIVSPLQGRVKSLVAAQRCAHRLTLFDHPSAGVLRELVMALNTNELETTSFLP